ncbi:hypothetical protein HMPREF1551_00913 [Capnocytophaga sp. oral taxon 863 str. F0517]|nr:hypothetical protein HMPREF1551_00913 [Capnocytophaga sp. oral taxon 863 str. F0517]
MLNITIIIFCLIWGFPWDKSKLFFRYKQIYNLFSSSFLFRYSLINLVIHH